MADYPRRFRVRQLMGVEWSKWKSFDKVESDMSSVTIDGKRYDSSFVVEIESHPTLTIAPEYDADGDMVADDVAGEL